MKKFMVIRVIDGRQSAAFFEEYTDAMRHKQNVECGMGGLAHLYIFHEEAKEYEFLEA